MAQSMEEKRKLYSLMEAAPEYCPDIETKWFAKGALEYNMSAPGEYQRFDDERRNWLRTFRDVGSRPIVCEALMQRYGPGGDLEIFQFK